MSIKFKISGGSYNVRQSELQRDVRPVSRLLRCRVLFLDDSEGSFEIDVSRFQWSVNIMKACNFCLSTLRG